MFFHFFVDHIDPSPFERYRGIDPVVDPVGLIRSEDVVQQLGSQEASGQTRQACAGHRHAAAHAAAAHAA
jgi:hypothetical protein